VHLDSDSDSPAPVDNIYQKNDSLLLPFQHPTY
jgi:hypothetical protein